MHAAGTSDDRGKRTPFAVELPRVSRFTRAAENGRQIELLPSSLSPVSRGHEGSLAMHAAGTSDDRGKRTPFAVELPRVSRFTRAAENGRQIELLPSSLSPVSRGHEGSVARHAAGTSDDRGKRTPFAVELPRVSRFTRAAENGRQIKLLPSSLSPVSRGHEGSVAMHAAGTSDDRGGNELRSTHGSMWRTARRVYLKRRTGSADGGTDRVPANVSIIVSGGSARGRAKS
jgi:hypothetical protein